MSVPVCVVALLPQLVGSVKRPACEVDTIVSD
jgi:hypothetical protein